MSENVQTTVFQPQSKIHYDLFSHSLKLMFGTLKRDMYGLVAVGFPLDEVKVPAHDPLATMRYSCVHWVDHLSDSVISKSVRCEERLRDGGVVHTFLKARYLYWLEALSLCESMPAGVASMAKLNALLQVIAKEQRLYIVQVLTKSREEKMRRG